MFLGLKWHEVLKIKTGFDVLKCPHCKTGNMIETDFFKGLKAPT